VMKKHLGPATALYGTIALSFVIPSEAEGSAVLLVTQLKQQVIDQPGRAHPCRDRHQRSSIDIW
jgi:hypothetical protein